MTDPSNRNLLTLARYGFGVTPDPGLIYPSPSHREALASLIHGIESDRGFMALIAPPGAGKTTLLFRLLEHYRKSADTVFLFQTQCDSRGLLHYLLADCGIKVEAGEFVHMHEALNQHLLRVHREGRRFLVFIDEAQNLKDGVLETVRLLSDFETPKAKLLQVVLSGQPRLLENLSRPEQSQLRQRISMFCQIDPLAPEEVLPYLQHRSRCGDWVCEALFTPDAIEHIAILSGGSPREINNICFNALSLAIGLGLDRIDGANIREVARQLMLPNPEDAPAVAVRKARTKQSKTPVQHHPAPQIVASPIITAPLGEAHAAGAAAVPAAASAPAAMPKPAPEPQVSKPAPEVAPPRIERERTNPPQSEDEWPTSIPAWYEVKPPKHSAPSVAESFLGSDLHRRLSEDASRESSIAGNRSSALVRAIAMIALLGIAIVAYFLLPWPRLQQLVNASVPAISSTAADAAPATSEADVTTKESSPPAPKKARKTARPPSAASASISRTIARDVPIGQIDRTGIATQTDSDPNMVPRVRPPVSDAALQQVLSTAAPNVTVTAESRATSEENASTGRQPRISGGVALTTPLPKYPEEARKMHLEGTVVLAATITTTGHLRNIRPVKGNLWLARAAMTAAEGWRYEPYLVDSVPTELETEIVFHFKPDQP